LYQEFSFQTSPKSSSCESCADGSAVTHLQLHPSVTQRYLQLCFLPSHHQQQGLCVWEGIPHGCARQK